MQKYLCKRNKEYGSTNMATLNRKTKMIKVKIVYKQTV